MASAANLQRDEKQLASRQQSVTTCSSSSSCYLPKRKQMHPLANPIRPYVSKNTNSSVKQRVLSARLLKLRSLQSQLNDANFHLAELESENRALRNMQFRQDKALTKYEGRTADLPRLLQSHEDEIRVINTKNKSLKKSLRDITEQLKLKEEELLNVREQLKNLTTLTKHKNLPERQALYEQNEELKEKLKACDDQINLLNRKLILESKNYKHKLSAESTKTKSMQKDLNIALNEIRRLNELVENRGRLTLSNRRHFRSKNQSQSSISLDNSGPKENVKFNLKSELALKAIINRAVANGDFEIESDTQNTTPSSIEHDISKMTNDIMISPSENIKARLSGNSISEDGDLKKMMEKVNLTDNGKNHLKCKSLNRPNSSHKLEKIQSSVPKVSANLLGKTKKQQEIENTLDNCCQEMKATVDTYSQMIHNHQQDFVTATNETEKLIADLKETDEINARLRLTNVLSKDAIQVPEEDKDLVNQIWQEEYDYQKHFGNCDDKNQIKDDALKSDTNGNVVKRDIKVALENKNKLLATLRAIDNGEEIDEIAYIGNSHKRHSKILDNIFDN